MRWVANRWAAPAIYGILGLELAAVTGFAVAYNALDFRIYMWGGHAVTRDTRLYVDLAYGHWFTYSPFAALVFVPPEPIALSRSFRAVQNPRLENRRDQPRDATLRDD